MATIASRSENSPRQESKGAGAAAAEYEPAQQVQRLNQRVVALEKELAASREKCGHYREFVKQWALAQHSSEELQQWALDDDLTSCLPLEQFIGELEAIVHELK